MMMMGKRRKGEMGMQAHTTYQNDVGSDPHGSTALVPSVSLVLGPLWLCISVVCVRKSRGDGSQRRKPSCV